MIPNRWNVVKIMQMDGQRWTVYEFHNSNKFEEDFPADNGWRLRVRHDDSENDYRLESADNLIGRSSDEGGSEWLRFGSDHYGDVSYIQVEDEVIRLAVGWTPEESRENLVNSYTVGLGSCNSLDLIRIFIFGFQWTVFVVWPVCAFVQSFSLSGAVLPIDQNLPTAL